jgi:AraC-like DNA-binding protein
MEAMRGRVLDYVEQHFSSPNLDSLHIRHEFRISRAHLYRLFPEYGGIQRYIQNRRTDAAFHELYMHPSQNFAKLESKCGFADEKHFRREFLKRFEIAPEEVASEHTPPTGSKGRHACP